MSSLTPLPPTPLSDDEYDQLAEWLEAHSPFETYGLLGLFHAVAVAPSVLAPSVWLPVVIPDGLGDLEPTEIQELVGLLFRLHGEVLHAINQQHGLVPEPEDVEECELFAAGYAAGAELDPEWLGNADRWTFAAPLAYLGGRFDLVPQKIIEDIERNLAPNPKKILCRDLDALIRSTDESFKRLRKAALSPMGQRKSPGSSRVGRNDPCPCGSGKKYKRCCIDTEPKLGAG